MAKRDTKASSEKSMKVLWEREREKAEKKYRFCAYWDNWMQVNFYNLLKHRMRNQRGECI